MTLNTLISFLLTLIFISGLYKRIMIKVLKKEFSNQDSYISFLEYGIAVASFRPFQVMKFLRLTRLVETNMYYKIISKIYLVQVLFSLLGFVALFIANKYDTLNLLSTKF